MKLLRFALPLALLAACLLESPNALAQREFANRDFSVTEMFLAQVSVNAGEQWTIETHSLSSAADTVLHVQNIATGAFEAGDDDSGPEMWSSRVVLPAATASKNLRVIIRAYGDTLQGTCKVRFFKNTVQQTNLVDPNRVLSVGGKTGTNFISSGARANTRLFTTEKALGAPDTVLLVVQNTITGLAFDDDNGVGNMSSLTLPQQCSGACKAIVGSFQGTPTGLTNVYMDSDWDINDFDADGLGGQLEDLIFSPIGNIDADGKFDGRQDVDSDGDGINDGDEVIGRIESNGNPAVKLATWGADPKFTDIFYEVDWLQCPPNSPKCGLDGIDAFRWTATEVNGMKVKFPGNFRFHFDIGVSNTNPLTVTEWGNWGGATSVAPTVDDWTTLTPARVGLFRSAKSDNPATDIGGLARYVGQPYYRSTKHIGSIVHETGHTLGLFHGGTKAATPMTCKPGYRSIMSYLGGPTHWGLDATLDAFSLGNSTPVSSIVPTALNETVGFGTTDSTFLTKLEGQPYFYKVNRATGAIDFNRDGQFDSAVRGAPGIHFANCDFAQSHPSGIKPNGNSRPATGDSPAITTTVVSGTRRIIVAYRRSDGKIEVNTSTGPTNCQNADWYGSCTTFSAITTLSTSQPGYDIAAVPVSTTSSQVLIVYVNSSFQLVSQKFDAANGTVTSPVVIGSNYFPVRPSTLLPVGGQPTMFVNFGNFILRFAYSSATQTWVDQAFEDYANSNPILLNGAVSVTEGIQRNEVGGYSTHLFAAYFNLETNKVAVARRNSTTLRWDDVTSLFWPSGAPEPRRLKGNGAFHYEFTPNLVYLPFSAGGFNDGRFIIQFNLPDFDPANGEVPNAHRSFQWMTEGNDTRATAQSRRFRGIEPVGQQKMQYLAADVSGNIAFLLDPTTSISLRAVYREHIKPPVHANAEPIRFLPFADGIESQPHADSNDITEMSKDIACSLTDCNL